MKINSENLYEYINNLATDEKVKFKVFYDDNYVTQIYWNGENFEWETGTFTSEAFFNPMYDFIPIEEENNIENNFTYIYDTGNEYANRNFENIQITLKNIIKGIKKGRDK